MSPFGQLTNPFELHGAESLTFFSFLSAILVLASFAVRRWFELSHPIGQSSPDQSQLKPYEIAYLAGRSERVQQVVLLTLIEQGLIEVEADKLIRGTSGFASSNDPIEQAVLDKVRHNPRSLDAVRLSMASGIHYLAERLRHRGLLFSNSDTFKIKAIAAGTVIAAIFAVLTKITIGIRTGYPVGFLVIIALVDLIFVLVHCAIPVSLTQAGAQALSQATTSVKSAAAHHRLRNRNLPMDVLLFASLAATAQSTELIGTSYHSNLLLVTPLPSSSDGGSGCGGGGGCGGGCGGGGCGG